VEEKNKEDTNEFQEDLDTDTFEAARVEGIERDKRGELAILLPDRERTIARRRGFTIAPPGEPAAADAAPVEKGSRFSGILRDDKGLIPVGLAETKGLITQVPGADEQAKSAVVDYGQTQILAPDKPAKPSVADFDLDFGPKVKKPAQAGPQEVPAPEAKEEAGRPKTKVRPAWMQPDEKEPLPAPSAQVEVEKPKKDIPFEEPDFPDTAAPVIVKRRRQKPSAEEKTEEKPQVARIKAHAYMEDEPIVKETQRTPTRVTPKKKMKLPKRVREKRTSPLLIVLVIILFLVLASVLVVQHVPIASKYYDSVAEKVFGVKRAARGGAGAGPAGEELLSIVIGGRKITLEKGTDLKAVKSYTAQLGNVFAQGKRATSGKEQ
jgi:hypothetical protein